MAVQRFVRRPTAAFITLLLFALILRIAAVAAQFDQLSVDRDGYLEIAAHIAQGEGFARTANETSGPQPTAYRPPLYPLLVAALFRLGARDVGLASLQVVLGVLTVLLTYVAGRRLGLGNWAFAAAVLVACDPLLLAYTAQPMTETLCAFLVALLLAVLVPTELSPVSHSGVPSSGEPGGTSALDTPHALRNGLIGGLFGLCLLCRPTIGAFGILMLAFWLVNSLRTRQRPRLDCWPIVVASMLVVSPWMIRNLLVIGRATPATTHGGYTLLLGNNPVFYHEVVAAPWGTVWDDSDLQNSQAVWLKRIESELHADLGNQADDEPSRDRWMYGRALDNIRAEPGLFLRACLLRFARFWNVVPLSPARAALPRPALYAVGVFYTLVGIGFIAGLAVLWRHGGTAWLPLLLMVAAFSLVHLLYWSNMRMRAPVIPAIALVAAAGVRGIARRRSQPSPESVFGLARTS